MIFEILTILKVKDPKGASATFYTEMSRNYYFYAPKTPCISSKNTVYSLDPRVLLLGGMSVIRLLLVLIGIYTITSNRSMLASKR